MKPGKPVKENGLPEEYNSYIVAAIMDMIGTIMHAKVRQLDHYNVEDMVPKLLKLVIDILIENNLLGEEDGRDLHGEDE